MITVYANYRLFRHIRKGVAGFYIVLLGLSPIMPVLAPVARAATVVEAETSVSPGPDESPVRPKTLKTIHMDSTAYTSRVEECDGDPFITADGSDVREGIVATNALPFGTKIRIPTIFGDRIFEVHDRMHARYYARVDIWMDDLPEARTYGVKRRVPIEVIEWGDNKTQWKTRAGQRKLARKIPSK